MIKWLFLSYLVLSSCKFEESPEGFLSRGKPVNYTIDWKLVQNYPKKIDDKIASIHNNDFPDSLRKAKKVFVGIRYNYFSGTKELDYIDTSGYYIVISNDSLKLFWEFDFEPNLSTSRIETISFEERNFFLEEGKKMKE